MKGLPMVCGSLRYELFESVYRTRYWLLHSCYGNEVTCQHYELYFRGRMSTWSGVWMFMTHEMTISVQVTHYLTFRLCVCFNKHVMAVGTYFTTQILRVFSEFCMSRQNNNDVQGCMMCLSYFGWLIVPQVLSDVVGKEGPKYINHIGFNCVS